MLFWTIFIFIVYVTCLPFAWNNHKYTGLKALCGIFIIAISTLRFDIGWDYQTYFNIIKYPDYSIDRMEPLSKLIFNLALYFKSPILLFGIFSILTYSLVIYSCYKYTKEAGLSLIVYLGLFYLPSLSIIRQGLAIAVIIFAVRFIQRKSYLKYYISIIVAFLFHYSAIVAIIFPLFYKTANLKTVFIYSLIIIIGFKFILEYVVSQYMPYYSVYLSSDFGGGSLLNLLLLLINSVGFILSYRNFGQSDITKLSIIPLIGSLCALCLPGGMGVRLASYFYIPLCYTVPAICKEYSRNITYICGLFFVSIFLFTVYVDSHNTKSSLSPYQSILTVDISNPHWK